MNLKRCKQILALICFMAGTAGSNYSALHSATAVDDSKVGAWYMYFWNADFSESPLGMQGDIQYRNWNMIGDLEQLLIRGGLTWQSKNKNVKLTAGYANITTGDYGDSSSTVMEHRIYQEALLPHQVISRIFLTHRFRFEQRFNEGQNFRTRYRYALFLNIPLNSANFKKNTWYLAFYNELFINAQKEVTDTISTTLFDRNRLYGALGYHVLDKLKIQLGYMRQAVDAFAKGQLQLSLHHNW